LWSILGAVLQQNNADQLVNPFLFQSSATWHATTLPAQHSFLIKWPLFFLIKLFGYTSSSYIALTVISVLVTIGIFAFILYKIERRPIVLGTIYLALASVLLLVPSQPYAGGILPVNMAMLTTRNLEYVLYILALYCIVSAKKFFSRGFILAVILLVLLLASDKLFMSVTVFAAGLALIIYSVQKRWQLVSLSSRWLVAGLLSSVIAVITLWIISITHITHISTQAIVGPYGVAQNSKSIFLGIFYALSGVFTNFGANPGYDALTIKSLPAHITHNLFSFYGLAYVVNILILLICIFICSRILLQSIGIIRYPKNKLSKPLALAVLLLWSTIAVVLLFIASNHYYVVDARYLTLSLFSFFISLAVWSVHKKKINIELIVLSVFILLLSIVSGVVGTIQMHSKQTSALSTISTRDNRIYKTLQIHHVKFLVGDYWRVIPIKSLSRGSQNVVPLANCTQLRSVLTSKMWQPNLDNTSFAYLLTLHGSLTDFPSCNINQIAFAYGLPNSSVLISGKLGNPDELLLFYDYGIHHPKHHAITHAQATATVLPTNLSDLTNTICEGPTIMNIVAHQDDDLLFMNPSILHDIRSGYCIRTIYLTAGDAGSSSPYWLSREKGSEAAYSYMLGGNQIWIQHTVRLPDGEYISLDQPLKNSKISLVFMHLPDGNLEGEGFSLTHYESLAELYKGNIKVMNTVDQQSTYTSQQLVEALTALMHAYLPTQIRTQANLISTKYPDHSDHMTVGHFVTKARSLYETQQFANQLQVPITYYIGYPIHEFVSDISGQDLIDKEAIFLAYSQYDGSVCHNLKQCQNSQTYGVYLSREYQNTY
jgi:LmbE family N-acetylglucosaminyl deacetylase